MSASLRSADMAPSARRSPAVTGLRGVVRVYPTMIWRKENGGRERMGGEEEGG